MGCSRAMEDSGSSMIEGREKLSCVQETQANCKGGLDGSAPIKLCDVEGTLRLWVQRPMGSFFSSSLPPSIPPLPLSLANTYRGSACPSSGPGFGERERDELVFALK